MKKIINLSFVLFILLFASCEGNTEYLLNVKNNSSEPIVIVPNIEMSYSLENFDTMNIAIGETKQIAHWNQRGGITHSVDITSNITSIYGVQASNKILDSVVYKTNSRWAERIEEKKKRPANYWHHYELTLVDMDFQ